MKIFFDTSVLMAAFWVEHPGHKASLSLFHRASPQHAFCGLHSLAEFYSSMTALPIHSRFDPMQISPLITELRNRCTFISLSEEDYASSIEKVASKGLVSSVIYDALLLRCAEKADADAIYTWNLKHFRQLSPELTSKIQTP